MTSKVLLVDDDPDLLDLVEFELRDSGYELQRAETARAAWAVLHDDPPHAIVLDLNLPDQSGKELLAQLQSQTPRPPVVILSAEDQVAEVVDCMQLGAVDYVTKPFDATRLRTSIRNAVDRGRLEGRLARLASELRESQGFGSLLGNAPSLRKATDLLRRAAGRDVTVLLHGESGTGKEVAARAVHAESARRDQPFVAVNCGAIPESLIESELFGHEKGAFTGAAAARAGYFEQAQGGTLFLDEIGELRIDLQVRLLRVLQESMVQRLGGTKPRKVDVRVIAATHVDLKAAIAARAFREDLYYRLAVFPVELPPLRDREGDVELLAEHFVATFSKKHQRTLRGLTPEAHRALRSYAWPGNVRELENVLERALILEDGPAVSLGSLPDEVVCAVDAEPSHERPTTRTLRLESGEILPFEVEEKRIIERALTRTGWKPKDAAEALQLGRATIYRKIEKYGLKAPE